MRLTFPHLGNAYIVVKTLFDELDIDYLIPPFNSKRALELGTKIAPELACLPMKINLGNCIEAYEKGADTILITGGCGPCRFGYYGEMERDILKDAGYKMDVITLEWPDKGLKEFLGRIRKLTGGLNAYRILKACKKAVSISKDIDTLEKLTFKTRPREIVKGSTDKIYKGFRNSVRSAKGYREIKKVLEEARSKLIKLETDKKMVPLKIGIVGEIYTTIDSYSNFGLETKLGNMGIEVDREVTVSGWIIEHMLKAALHIPRNLRYKKAAEPYLGVMIGGHAQETIGNTIIYSKSGYDGVIQIYPLTCMPEIVAQSILPAVERDFDIPVLTLIIDELSGEAGYMTRLEAFSDLIKKRRERRENGENWALSGD